MQYLSNVYRTLGHPALALNYSMYDYKGPTDAIKLSILNQKCYESESKIS